MDSVIDFLIGDENVADQVAINLNNWLDIFAPATILAVHHFKKADPRNKIKAADMMRGSSVWLSTAQSVLALSVIEPSEPERLLVESTKNRAGRKLKPFEMKMIVKPNPFNIEETIVDGFKYVKEINEVKLKSDSAKEAVKQFLYDHLETGFTANEIVEGLTGNNLGDRNIRVAVSQMAADGDIQIISGSGKRGDPKVYKLPLEEAIESL
jgi:RecA-family ATPase